MRPIARAFQTLHQLGLKPIVTIFPLLILTVTTLARSPRTEPSYGNGQLLITAGAATETESNVALATGGAVATASSAYAGWAASGANNGDRKGLNAGQDGGWVTAQAGFPAWLQVDFSSSKTIDEIDIFTLQDNWMNPSEPTESMTFSLYGLTGYEAQYWNGISWVPVPGGSATGNNEVWRKFTFSPITTRKVRVLTNASTDGYSRLVEVEAWGTDANLYEPPIADVSGPYSGVPGGGVQFSGLASGDSDGWITSYVWSFGDGTTATGETPTHTYSAEGTYTVRLTVTDNSGVSSTSETTVTVNAQTVVINFDNVATSTIVTNQYGQAHFSSYGFSGGAGGPFGHNIYTINDCNVGGSCPNGIESADGYSPNWDTYVDFPVPVNGLTFRVLNAILPNGSLGLTNPKCWIDVYVNHSFYGTYAVYQTGPSFRPIFVGGLSTIADVTGIRIHNIFNCTSIECYGIYPLVYDDFTFTPNLNINITNYRINNNQTIINGTTQFVLLGGEVNLETFISPANATGGTYSWSITGPHTVTGGTNQSSLNVRWTEPGSYVAKVTYTSNDMSTSSAITVNVIVPDLTGFYAQADPERVTRGSRCSNMGTQGDDTATFTLGCWQGYGTTPSGILFTATAQIPSHTYLSNPGESGIKIKQYIKEFNKRVNDRVNGNFQCEGHRDAQGQLTIAWQQDGTEDISPLTFEIPPRFYQGNTLIHRALDAPGNFLEGKSPNGQAFMHDVVYVEEFFETYVEYFVGNDYESPVLTLPLKLTSENDYRYSRIQWDRNGQVAFDPSVPTVNYRIEWAGSTHGTVQATGTNNLPTYVGNGNALINSYGPCPSDPAPSTNRIDGARCFVTQQYWDFLNRGPDEGGLDFWTYQIARCAFDRTCISSKRNAVARSFFDSAEFALIDPAMGNPPGSANFTASTYNPAFVRHCYNNFLQRQPEQEGLAFWVDVLNRTGDYDGVINAFITSDEYRNYRVFHDCP